MRILRNKHHRKILQQYRILYGIVPRYKVLLDGNFLHIACICKVDLPDMLPKLLQTPNLVLFVTKCVMAELRALGPDFDDTCAVANTMKFAKCKHKSPVSAAECIQSLVGGRNSNHYFVATQDTELRGAMREVPGTPLLLFNRQVLVLDKLSQTSLDMASKKELKKVQPSKQERRMLHALHSAKAGGTGAAAGAGAGAGAGAAKTPVEAAESGGDGAGAEASAPKPKPKRKRGPQAPNPLSVKKKKKRPAPAGEGQQQATKKRRRKRRNKTNHGDGEA